MAAYYSPLICTVIGGGVDVSRASVLTSTLFILPPCGYLFAITAIARVLNPDLHPFRPFSVLNPHLLLLRHCQHGAQVLSCSSHVSIP